LDIELSDAYYGSRKIIKLNRNRICKTCTEKNLLEINNQNCEECGGKKYSLQLKEVQLIIKPGTYTGCKVTFKGEGEEYLDVEPGDIIFDIHVKDNKNFLRKGSDLYIHKNLSISEFLGMDNILITLFGKTKFYANKNKIIINPGEVKTIIGKGFPFFDKNSQRGNLHIKFNVSFPLNLKFEQKKIIKNVLEGNYLQYIRNMNTTAERKLLNNITLNKNNVKKNNTNNTTAQNNYKPIKKTKFIPKFNIKRENNNQNAKNKNMNINNNYNPTRSKSELNKSFNKKSQVNNPNQNEKELKNLEIYELVKFDESLVNKSYFFEKSNKNKI
jgi:DnaJ-class molecular chaperone